VSLYIHQISSYYIKVPEENTKILISETCYAYHRASEREHAHAFSIGRTRCHIFWNRWYQNAHNFRCQGE